MAYASIGKLKVCALISALLPNRRTLSIWSKIISKNDEEKNNKVLNIKKLHNIIC